MEVLFGKCMKYSIGDLLHSRNIDRLYTVININELHDYKDAIYEVEYYCNHHKQHVKSRMLGDLIEDMDFDHYVVVR